MQIFSTLLTKKTLVWNRSLFYRSLKFGCVGRLISTFRYIVNTLNFDVCFLFFCYMKKKPWRFQKIMQYSTVNIMKIRAETIPQIIQCNWKIFSWSWCLRNLMKYIIFFQFWQEKNYIEYVYKSTFIYFYFIFF